MNTLIQQGLDDGDISLIVTIFLYNLISNNNDQWDGFYVTPELELGSTDFGFTIGGEAWNGPIPSIADFSSSPGNKLVHVSTTCG